MNTLKISDIPTLARWTEVGMTEDDNSLNVYIKELQVRISELVTVEDNFAPLPGEGQSKEYTIINKSCRLMASLCSELKSMRSEIKAAKLISDAGLTAREGGVR